MKEHIDLNNVPKHIAIIMDGNGRWAQKKGAKRIFGHQNAVQSVREAIEGAGEVGVKYLTLYAFSTENWKRPEYEVNALMQLLVSTLKNETKQLMENNVRLHAIGNLPSLPLNCQSELNEAIQTTSKNTGIVVNLALSYSGRWEILEAAKKILKQAKEGIISESMLTDDMFSSLLSTNGLPDPELLVRTSGELRISNFLLWQCAYSELYFTDVLWPDFRKKHLWEAILSYQQRERRFGKTGEQVSSDKK